MVLRSPDLVMTFADPDEDCRTSGRSAEDPDKRNSAHVGEQPAEHNHHGSGDE
jgi:hypothetical protein